MNTLTPSRTTGGRHRSDKFHFLCKVDGRCRKKQLALDLGSLVFRLRVNGREAFVRTEESRRSCCFNKTDEMTSWKDKHGIFWSYQEKYILPLGLLRKSSAKLARCQYITGNAQTTNMQPTQNVALWRGNSLVTEGCGKQIERAAQTDQFFLLFLTRCRGNKLELNNWHLVTERKLKKWTHRRDG